MKYREGIELRAIILDLAATKGGVRITRLMYNSFLSYGPLKKYIQTLIDDEVLRYEEKNEVYRTTKKGLQYLDLYKQMEKIVKRKSRLKRQ